MKSKINILGVTYTCEIVDNKDGFYSEENLAECDYDLKTIKVLKIDVKTKEEYSKEWLEETFVHELAHAFLYETGQSDINNERTVEVMSKFARFVYENMGVNENG